MHDDVMQRANGVAEDNTSTFAFHLWVMHCIRHAGAQLACRHKSTRACRHTIQILRCNYCWAEQERFLFTNDICSEHVSLHQDIKSISTDCRPQVLLLLQAFTCQQLPPT